MPDEIIVSELPSVAFADRRAMPAIAAIYFVLDSDRNVIYIGKAQSLNHRWVQHHRKSQVKSVTNARIAWLRVDNPDILNAIERDCITQFRPPLNQSDVLFPLKKHASDIFSHGRVRKNGVVHLFRNGAHMCGSGMSSWQSLHTPHYPTNDPVTCKLCQSILAKYDMNDGS